MTKHEEFSAEVEKNIHSAGKDNALSDLTNNWLRHALQHNYAYNFSWLGRPIIQIPQDIYAIQEFVWKIKPDLIIETGIAHGGSLIMSASMLAMLDYCDAVSQGKSLDPGASKRQVLGIDIEIRSHNREAIEAHPLSHLIQMIEGSSITSDVIQQVKSIAKDHKKILIFLDSNHTHKHVLAELEAYAGLVSVGSYCVVWDTGIEDLPAGSCPDRPWGKGNNPKTAVLEYLSRLDQDGRMDVDGRSVKFEIDKFIESQLLITAVSDGFLKRVG